MICVNAVAAIATDLRGTQRHNLCKSGLAPSEEYLRCYDRTKSLDLVPHTHRTRSVIESSLIAP